MAIRGTCPGPQRRERHDRTAQNGPGHVLLGVHHGSRTVHAKIEIERLLLRRSTLDGAVRALDGRQAGHHHRARQHALEPIHLLERHAELPGLQPLGQRILRFGQLPLRERDQVGHGALAVVADRDLGVRELHAPKRGQPL